MKRDLELIKKILIHIEEKDDIKPSELIIKGYDNELANLILGFYGRLIL